MEVATNQAAGASANTASATRRHDVYGLIHMGLRAFMVDTLARVGRVDVESESSVRRAIEQTRGLLTKLAVHLAHENIYLHPALEARSAGSAAATTLEHADHERAFAELGVQVEELSGRSRRGGPSSSRRRSQALYLSLSFFVAENMAHMYPNERVGLLAGASQACRHAPFNG